MFYSPTLQWSHLAGHGRLTWTADFLCWVSNSCGAQEAMNFDSFATARTVSRYWRCKSCRVRCFNRNVGAISRLRLNCSHTVFFVTTRHSFCSSSGESFLGRVCLERLLVRLTVARLRRYTVPLIYSTRGSLYKLVVTQDDCTYSGSCGTVRFQTSGCTQGV